MIYNSLFKQFKDLVINLMILFSISVVTEGQTSILHIEAV